MANRASAVRLILPHLSEWGRQPREGPIRRLTMTSMHAFSTDLPDWRVAIAEGDVVSVGPNGVLTLEIMAVRGDKAWVRDLDGGRDGVIDLNDFKRLALDALGGLQ